MTQDYTPDTGQHPIADDDGDSIAEARAKPRKAPNAFRTISEVADDLHIPQHVLRFWETKFPQVKPLKRGGGRRYYRPDDISLLRRISDLLYIQGYTIKGVQRLLREGGGKLSDEIPPPTAEEQAGAEDAVQEEDAQLPMPGLMPKGDEASRVIRSARTAPSGKPAKPADTSEVEVLRAALARALAELREIRALLP